MTTSRAFKAKFRNPAAACGRWMATPTTCSSERVLGNSRLFVTRHSGVSAGQIHRRNRCHPSNKSAPSSAGEAHGEPANASPTAWTARPAAPPTKQWLASCHGGRIGDSSTDCTLCPSMIRGPLRRQAAAGPAGRRVAAKAHPTTAEIRTEPTTFHRQHPSGQAPHPPWTATSKQKNSHLGKMPTLTSQKPHPALPHRVLLTEPRGRWHPTNPAAV